MKILRNFSRFPETSNGKVQSFLHSDHVSRPPGSLEDESLTLCLFTQHNSSSLCSPYYFGNLWRFYILFRIIQKCRNVKTQQKWARKAGKEAIREGEWICECMKMLSFVGATLNMRNERRVSAYKKLHTIIGLFCCFPEELFENSSKPPCSCLGQVSPRSLSSHMYGTASRKDWHKLRCRAPWWYAFPCPRAARRWGWKKKMAKQRSSKLRHASSGVGHRCKQGS